MTDVIKINIDYPDLSSRKTAALQRTELLNAIQRGPVVLDLAAVESISDSYADELFGVIAAVHGLDWLSQHVKIAGAKEPVLRAIAVAVKRRISEPQVAA